MSIRYNNATAVPIQMFFSLERVQVDLMGSFRVSSAPTGNERFPLLTLEELEAVSGEKVSMALKWTLWP